MRRRQIILGAGGLGLALVGGTGWWAATREPQSARAPWRMGPAPADVRLDAFRHAILAPNPHNRQPWLIRLDGADSATIACDLDRRLPQTDPFDRQITIGFGTFLELARIAASARGYRLDAAIFPDGEPQPRLDRRPVARLRFVRDTAIRRDPLLDAILIRRTTREPFAAEPPPMAKLAAAAGADARVSAEPALVARLRAIAVNAITTEIETPRTYRESIDVMRIGAAEIDANPDGIALDGPMIELAGAAGIITRESLIDPDGAGFKTGLDQMRNVYGSVPAVLWVTTPANTRADQIDAGRRYARATLRAAALGLAVHPMSQALQEYGEVAADYAAIHRVLGVGGGARLQMFARIGTGPVVPPAPRWPLESHMR